MSRHRVIASRVRQLHDNPVQAIIDIIAICDEIDTIEKGDAPEKPVDLAKVVEEHANTVYTSYLEPVALLLYIAREKAAKKVMKLEKAVRDEVEA